MNTSFDTRDLFINIIIGIAMGCILYRIFFDTSIIRGPNSKDIVNQIFVLDGDKYKLEPKVCACPLR